MARTSTKIFVLEVMGRHAGWIAAAGGLAAEKEGDSPHIILFPEVIFNQEKFLAKVNETVEKFGFCCIVVSEGVKNPEGKFLAEAGTRDAFGHAQLGGVAPVVAQIIKEALGYKYHWAVADYLQRAARHIASKTDVEQAYAMGKAAVEFALAGKTAVMPTIVRTSNNPYQWEIGCGDLKDVANVEQKLPERYITDDGFGITAACEEYLRPLIMGEDYPEYVNGLPNYVTLKNVSVTKILNTPFEI
jgi:6-phosphofructokinase